MEWDMWNNAVKRSINLRSFIARCIRRNPENRIGLDELYAKLKQMKPLGDLAMERYLQNAMNGSQPRSYAHDVTFGGPQKYAIGMTYTEPSGFGSSDLSDTDMIDDDGGVPVQRL